MNSTVLAWARACSDCLQSKVSRHVRLPLTVRTPPDHRFYSIHVDLVGPLPISEGMRYLFTIVDRYSRWVEAVPLPTMSAEDCASALIRCWISRFGVPGDITTDQGRQFTGNLWKELHRIMGIKSLRTTAYHPQTNGMVERFHRVLKERLMARDPTGKWMSHLPMVLLGVRSSIREDGNISPAHLVYGVPLRLPGQLLCGPAPADRSPPPSSFAADLEQSMALAAPLPVAFHGERPVQLPQSLSLASAVYVRVDAVHPPLHRPHEGPFPVINRNAKTFTLRRNGKDWVGSIDRLKAAAPSLSLTNFPSSPPLDDAGDDGPALYAPAADLGVIGPPATPEPTVDDPDAAVVVPQAPVAAATVAPILDPVPEAEVGPLVSAAPDSPLRTRSGRASVPPQRYQA